MTKEKEKSELTGRPEEACEVMVWSATCSEYADERDQYMLISFGQERRP